MTARLLIGIAAVALTGAGLAGCSSAPNRSVYSIHQPVVERQTYAIDVNAGPGGLAPGEAARLDGWFAAMNLGYGDRVAVDQGTGTVDPAVLSDVARVAGESGMQVADRAPVIEGAIEPGTARIVVTRSRATVESCPNWSQQSESDFTGGSHSNFGCSMAKNYAAMIADPEDLVRGRDDDLTDPNTASKPIDAQRRRPAKAGEVQGGGVGG